MTQPTRPDAKEPTRLDMQPITGASPDVDALRDPTPTTDDLGAPAPSDDLARTGPPVTPDKPESRPSHADGSLPVVPGYEIDGVLGAGGMGVVYRARHVTLKRAVALKVIRGHAGEQQRARFRAEAEAAARLSHPHIVQLYEVGEHDGMPFCALEFVAGDSLADRIKKGRLPPREAARLIEQLGGALHLAHSRNVIHRDLKPSNILLTRDGTPKVTDFGLARQLDVDSGQTRAGMVLGTPSYMAPEQASGQAHVAGPAADVYALGAILYETLTGQPPFRGDSVLETLEQVRTREPVPPTRLCPAVPRDLETVCLKCLRKEPERRYAGAQALADDLRRWQAGEPIQARAVGPAERAAKWVRRNPVVATLLALVALAVAGGGVGTYVKYLDAEEQATLARDSEGREKAEREKAQGLARERAQALAAVEKQLARAEFVAYAYRLREAQAEIERGRSFEAQRVLASCDPRLGQWEYDFLLRQTDRLRLEVGADAAEVAGVCYGPDGKQLASAHGDGTVRLWDAETGPAVLTLRGHAGRVAAVCFRPDGRHIASGSGDNTVKVWDARTGRELFTLRGHAGTVSGVCYRGDGERLASGSWDGTAVVWDLEKKEAIFTLKGHTSLVLGLCFSPDGERLATASGDRLVKVWDMRTGEELLSLRGHTDPVTSVCFSPDGKHVAAGSWGNTLRVWDSRTGEEAFALRARVAGISSVSFSPDGRQLAGALIDRTVSLWDVETRREVHTLRGHTGVPRSVCFSPDGHRLASAGVDRTVRVWDLRTGQPSLALKGHLNPVDGVCFDPDGRRLATSGEDQTVKVWDVAVTGR